MTVAGAGPPMGASPYATGGGGTVLEHRYGAILLACLLIGGPMTELGDDTTPVVVRFQASSVSSVDDLLVVGRTPDGGERRGWDGRAWDTPAVPHQPRTITPPPP